MTRVRYTLAALGVVLAGQASALSCLRPDAADTFQRVAAAEERYVVLLGTFDFVAPPAPEVTDINSPAPQSVVATFEGQGLAATRFGRVAPLQVTIETSCAGPWCGGFPAAGENVLAFVEQTDDGYVLTMGPCGGSVFAPRVAPVVAACMRGETCEPEDPLR